MDNAIKIQFDHWMNHHADSQLVNKAWQQLEIEDSGKYQEYLSELEYQAFSGGFAAGVLLMTECFAGGEKA